MAENILLGRLPRRGPLGVAVDWSATYARAEAVLASMNVRLDIRAKVGRLSVAQQQVVEIAKAMSFNPSVLMLDEPTSALARHETQSLFALVRQLAARGVAVVYITHRLQELKEIADTVSVLRDGAFVGCIPIDQASPQTLVRMMFGQTVPKSRPAEVVAAGEPVLEVSHVSRAGLLHDVSFTLHKGEVLGIAGMLGSGRTELLMSIFGAQRDDSGRIVLRGHVVRHPSPARMKRLGLALAPENRKEQGLVLGMSTRDNLCLAGLGRIGRGGLIWKGLQRAVARRTVEELAIRAGDIEQPVSSLSGGNQQKVVVGNWLNAAPSIVLFDEPTRGIDVQAKQQIFQLIWGLSRRGISSIFVSSELEELLEVCHRILILHKAASRPRPGQRGWGWTNCLPCAWNRKP